MERANRNRVITMGCATEVRAIRDEVKRRVTALIDALAADGLGDCAADA